MPPGLHVAGFLGLSDSLKGVLLGWGLATVTAAATGAVAAYRRRRDAQDNRRNAARLILEELKVAQRAVREGDARLLAGAMALPTDICNQRREHLLGSDEWCAIAEASGEINELNVRRTSQAMWRVEQTARRAAQGV